MRNLAVAFLLGLIVLLAHAQVFSVDKTVLCSDLKTVIEVSSGEYQEEPTWRGSDSTSKYVMMSNSKTGTWTFIQYNDKIACVLGTGQNSKPILTGKYI